MPRLRSIGFALAAFGVVLSAMVHVASLFAAMPREVIPPLFVGAIVLAGPLVVTARLQQPRRIFGPSFRDLMKGAPSWAARAFQVAFLYVVLQLGTLVWATRTLAADRPAPPGAEVRVASAFAGLLYLLCAFAWWTRPAARRPGRSDR